jgi:hypothetical protein
MPSLECSTPRPRNSGWQRYLPKDQWKVRLVTRASERCHPQSSRLLEQNGASVFDVNFLEYWAQVTPVLDHAL